MARVQGKNTKPELAVRKIAHSLGYRFRLHRKDLPGSPDIVFPASRAIIFVHGCFWHRHAGCRKATTPKTRAEFWGQKFRTNTLRDSRNIASLADLGWRVMVVWECELDDPNAVASRLEAFLEGTRAARI